MQGPGLDCPFSPAALSEAAEVYFSAIQKIGEQALQSPTSQILGEALPSTVPPFSHRAGSLLPIGLLPGLRGQAWALPLPPRSSLFGSLTLPVVPRPHPDIGVEQATPHHSPQDCAPARISLGVPKARSEIPGLWFLPPVQPQA